MFLTETRVVADATTRYTGKPDEWSSSRFFSLLLHAFGSPAVNHCCLESKITGAGVSPDSLIDAPLQVVGSAPRMDLDCQLRRSWRSSRLPTSLGSNQSSLPYSLTTGTVDTGIALTLAGTTPYDSVGDRSHASAALAFFMNKLWCSLNVRCASSRMPSERVT